MKARNEASQCRSRSPALLQRSGPAFVLLSGVPCATNCRASAKICRIIWGGLQYRCKQPITINGYLGWLSKFKIGAQWVLTKTGQATNHFESRIYPVPCRPSLPGYSVPFSAGRYPLPTSRGFDGHGFQVQQPPIN